MAKKDERQDMKEVVQKQTSAAPQCKEADSHNTYNL